MQKNYVNDLFIYPKHILCADYENKKNHKWLEIKIACDMTSNSKNLRTI